jgi:hypothetical protein
LTKRALLKKERDGLYLVDTEWEEISRGLYANTQKIDEPVIIFSKHGSIKKKEVQRGLYEITN